MKYVIKELRRHLWRTIAGISGYAIAGLFILLLLSITDKNEKDSFGILKGTGTHFILYIPSKTSCCLSEKSTGSIFADGVYTQMLNRELIDSVKEIEGVRDAAPYLLYQIYDSTFKAQISLGGIDTSNIATKNNVCAATNLIAGKFLSNNPNEIVAEESFAVCHKLKLGDTLNIFGGRMVLAGIINSGIKPGKADFYSSIENVRNILQYKLHCNAAMFDMNIILVEVADSRIQNRVIDQLKRKMNYLAVSSYNCYQPASKVMTIMSRTSAILFILIIVFLVVFSAKTQLTSLVERYREIGILKSLGWSNTRLSSQIMLTSIIQALIGVVIGISLCAFCILILNIYQIHILETIDFQIHYKNIVLLIVLSVTGSIIACMLPIAKLHRTKAGDMIHNYL